MALATPTTRFARQQTNRLLTDLRRKLARTAKSADPTPIHDLRVAIRRFQQALTVFSPAFPADERKKIRRKLKLVMGPAGEVRNCDIASILIQKLDAGSARQLRHKIQRDRKTADRELAKSLRQLIDRKLPAKWCVALELNHAAAKNASGRPEIPQALHRKVAQMAIKFLALGRRATHPDTPAREVHRFRIASKKFRYTLELVEAFYGAALTPWLEQIKGVQSVLGDANDCEIVRQMIKRWSTGEQLIARLEKRQMRKLMKFRREWAAMPPASAFPSVLPPKTVAKESVPRRGAAASSSRSASPRETARSATSRSAAA